MSSCRSLLALVMIWFANAWAFRVRSVLQRPSQRWLRSNRPAGAVSSKAKSTACTVVIVESPAKARTIQKYLDGDTHIVDFSAGHIRDLASKSEEASYLKDITICKEIGLKASNVGVDVFNSFKPVYVPMAEKREVIKRLRELSKRATRIILATDEDREGEAISWHLTEVLQPTVPYKRAVFHEITKDAILKAFESPRDIDMDLVRSQETRRILDRLAGFTVSPVLWRFVAPGLSAGRVQSCGLFSITERERSRWKFVPSTFCSLSALLETAPASTASVTATDGAAGHTVLARLQAVNARRVATEKDFDPETGALRTARSGAGSPKAESSGLLVLNESVAAELSSWLSSDGVSFRVSHVDHRKTSRKPPPPFITSSLQREASRKLGLSPARTMAIAQGLYERGYITYMRTDSYTLSSAALTASHSLVTSLFGAEYLGSEGSTGKGKSASPKNAQEAHEAIRPAEVNGKFALPNALVLSGDEHKLYSLILRRTLASVMAPSQAATNTYTILAGARNGTAGADGAHQAFNAVTFKSSDTVTVFPGYLAAMSMFAPGGGAKSQSPVLAQLSVGQTLRLSPRRTWEATAVGAVASAEEPVDEGDDVLAEGPPAPETEGNSTENVFVSGLKTARHQTRPPSRFTESSFIQEMENLGVGRPSTYAAILHVLKERGYIVVDRQTIVPTVRGMVVSAFLEKHFPRLVDARFTAEMERNLDLIAHHECNPQDFLHQFYLADSADQPGLLPTVRALMAEGAVDFSTTRQLQVPFLADLGVLSLSRDTVKFQAYADPPEEGCPSSGGSSRRRTLSDRTWTLPEAMQADLRQITPEGVRAVMETAPSAGLSVGQHPSSQRPMSFKVGRFGPYLQVGTPPKDVTFYSLPSWMETGHLTAEDAVLYTSLPRDLGEHPDLNRTVQLLVRSGKLEITVQGYGARCELPPGTHISDVTLDTALAALPDAQRIISSMAGDRELGTWKGFPVYEAVGPYGPYVRWKNRAAKLDLDGELSTVSFDEAVELIEASGKVMGSSARKWKTSPKKEKKQKVKGGKDSPAALSAAIAEEAGMTKRGRPKAKPKTVESESSATGNDEAVPAPSKRGRKKATSSTDEATTVEAYSAPATAAQEAPVRRGRKKSQE